MNSAERAACDSLVRSSKLVTDHDIAQYLEVARRLPMSHDPEVLGVMLNCLNSADAGEVQFELIEATERFPDHVYVREVLPRAKQLVEQAGDWGWMVIQTLLNTNSCLECALLEFSKLDKDTKKNFESVLSELCDRDPSYAERRLMFVG